MSPVNSSSTSAPPTTDPLKQVFLGQLAQRFISKLDERRAYIQKRYQRKHWITRRSLAEKTGMSYEAVMHYLHRKDRKMSFEVLDKLMWAANITVLDLLEPNEIFSYLESLDYVQRNVLRGQFKSLLDRRDEKVSNQISAQSTDSQ